MNLKIIAFKCKLWVTPKTIVCATLRPPEERFLALPLPCVTHSPSLPSSSHTLSCPPLLATRLPPLFPSLQIA